MKHTAAAIVLVLTSGTAAAQVYKCQQAGQVVYSDKPCPNAKAVDTTNGKSPTLSDQYRAKARTLRDRSTLIQSELDKAREARERERCALIAKDANWTADRARKYKTDIWWQNAAAEDVATLNKQCGKYLIPAGAGHN